MTQVSYAVILTRGVDGARRAIDAIAAQTPSSELLLVLNDADDAMRAYARTLMDAEGARVLHDGADLGIAMGWNLALDATSSPFVCVVHEDSDLGDGCAAQLLQTLHERPDAGAACPRSLRSDGTILGAGAVVWSDGHISRWVEDSEDVHAVDHATSSCLMLRREAALAVGGFDNRFFPAVYVDVAISVALWRAGWSVLCDPRVTNVHHTGAMVDAARGPRRSARMRAYLLHRNHARFREAHREWLARQPDRANPHDSSRVEPDEWTAKLRVLREHEAAVRAVGPPTAPPSALHLPEDPSAEARRCRQELEDGFMGHLVAREQALVAELEDLHRRYATLHAEHVALREEAAGVHAAYADLWADRERLLADPPADP